jgi:hypothetical protein
LGSQNRHSGERPPPIVVLVSTLIVVKDEGRNLADARVNRAGVERGEQRGPVGRSF